MKENKEDPLSFEIVIEFDKKNNNPEHLFESVSRLIAGFSNIDDSIVSILNENLKYRYVLESVSEGSIKIKIANFLRSFDDKDVENLDHKRIIGKFVNAGRHLAINMLEKDIITPELVSNYEESLLKEAKPILLNGRSPKSLPRSQLLVGIEKTVSAASILSKGETISYISEQKKVQIKPKAVVDESNYKVSLPDTSKKTEGMIIKVKKADLLGNSKWEFLFEEQPIKANISDTRWLDDYHKKAIVVGPGDSLRVLWEYTYSKSKGRYKVQSGNIIKVLDVIPGKYEEQPGLF